MRDDIECDVCGCKHQRHSGCSTQAVSFKITKLKAENKTLNDIKSMMRTSGPPPSIVEVMTEFRDRAEKAEAENKAQLAELTAISDALGTREGHSSVSHIEAMQAEVKLLTEALEAIVKHQLIVGGSLATYSATVKIAEKALKGE